MNHPHNVYLGDDLYELTDDYTFVWAEGSHVYRINVPAGYVCDLASIPRAAWSVIGLTPGAEMTGPGTLHDFLYGYGGILPAGSFQELVSGIWWDITEPWNRAQADALFLITMKESGVAWHRRQLAWYAVRSFGGPRWGNTEAKEEKMVLNK